MAYDLIRSIAITGGVLSVSVPTQEGDDII